jgi:hypothetical protein
MSGLRSDMSGLYRICPVGSQICPVKLDLGPDKLTTSKQDIIEHIEKGNN